MIKLFFFSWHVSLAELLKCMLPVRHIVNVSYRSWSARPWTAAVLSDLFLQRYSWILQVGAGADAVSILQGQRENGVKEPVVEADIWLREQDSTGQDRTGHGGDPARVKYRGWMGWGWGSARGQAGKLAAKKIWFPFMAAGEASCVCMFAGPPLFAYRCLWNCSGLTLIKPRWLTIDSNWADNRLDLQMPLAKRQQRRKD